MAEVWKPKDPKLLKSWLDAILEEATDDLNTWELMFISDIERLIDAGRILSKAQEDKLEQIYANKTP